MKSDEANAAAAAALNNASAQNAGDDERSELLAAIREGESLGNACTICERSLCQESNCAKWRSDGRRTNRSDTLWAALMCSQSWSKPLKCGGRPWKRTALMMKMSLETKTGVMKTNGCKALLLFLLSSVFCEPSLLFLAPYPLESSGACNH
jgi:hypothetical protein